MVVLMMTSQSPGVSMMTPSTTRHNSQLGHDYMLKFLLVGDGDVGKQDILDALEGGAAASTSNQTTSGEFRAETNGNGHEGENQQQQFCSHHAGIHPRETYILLEGKQVKLQLWDTGGQGRLPTIIRSYSRGAQGVLLVYDITNRWSFDGIGRWLKEIDEHAPGIPKVLLGNQLHLEFNRKVSYEEAQHFARKKKMEYFEISTLAPFNIQESLTELSRLVLTRNGMERLWKGSRVSSLHESCCRSIVRQVQSVHLIDRLPLPLQLRNELRSFANSGQLTGANLTLPHHRAHHKRSKSEILWGVHHSSSNGGPKGGHHQQYSPNFNHHKHHPSDHPPQHHHSSPIGGYTNNGLVLMNGKGSMSAGRHNHSKHRVGGGGLRGFLRHFNNNNSASSSPTAAANNKASKQQQQQQPKNNKPKNNNNKNGQISQLQEPNQHQQQQHRPELRITTTIITTNGDNDENVPGPSSRINNNNNLLHQTNSTNDQKNNKTSPSSNQNNNTTGMNAKATANASSGTAVVQAKDSSINHSQTFHSSSNFPASPSTTPKKTKTGNNNNPKKTRRRNSFAGTSAPDDVHYHPNSSGSNSNTLMPSAATSRHHKHKDCSVM